MSHLPPRIQIVLPQTLVQRDGWGQLTEIFLIPLLSPWPIPSLTSWLPAGPASDCQPETSHCPRWPGTSGSGTCWAESNRHTWAPASLQEQMSWQPIKWSSDNGLGQRTVRNSNCWILKKSLFLDQLVLFLLSDARKRITQYTYLGYQKIQR